MTLSILCSLSAFSQQASYGNVYIFKPGTAVFYGNHSFQSGGNTPGNGIIGTDRDISRSTYTFHTSSAIPADMANTKHVNGYVKATPTASASGFTFPVGSGSFYAPASIAKFVGTSDIEAAYFKANAATAIVPDMKGGNYAALPTGAPFILSSKGINIDSVSNVEYWDLNGSDPVILTLSFDAARSNVNALTGGDISKLIIVGWDGTKWVSLGGVSATGTISTSGTITTANSFVPNNFTAYTFASSCTKPTLTVGNISCTGSSYQINFTSNATKGVLSSLGTVSGNTITGISKNTTVTITASNGGTCTSVSTITTPNLDCPTPCVLPQLTAGNGLCNGGTTWEFAFIETTGATVSTSAGTISGRKVTNIPVGTSVTLSASNGSCTSTVNVSSPSNCNDTCNNPLISVAGTNCKADGTAFYTIYFLKASSRVSVSANAGTVSGDSVINIPSGTKVTLTATTAGCSNSTIIDVESKACPTCVKPSLTAGNVACDGTSYTINFLTNATNGVVSSTGTVATSKITGVAKNTSVTITASNGSGCTTSAIVTTPNSDCPSSCVLPQLQAGTGVCNGSTWQFSFIESTGASISASSGTVSGNKVTGIAVGTNVEITATSATGNCVSKITVNSPATCNDPCSSPLVSVGGTNCKADGSAFYSVSFLKLNSSVNVTASAGTVSGDSVINIPSGTNVVISATLSGCKDTTKLTVSSKTCPTCTKPSITAGNVNCSGSTYTLNFLSNATNGVTSSEGTVSGNAVTGILKNRTVTLTASNGTGCTNSISVSTPNVDCPSSCVTPQLTAGSGICNGTTWDVSFVESTGANIIVSAGTKGNNKVTGISVGTNLTITAINGSCATTITINSPTGCSNPCANPLASIGGSLCKTDGSAFYTAYFTKLDNTVSVTASAGNVSGDSVVNIPSGTDVTITASRPGCSVNTVVKVPARQCPSCTKPSLTVGNLSCNGTSYNIDYMTDAINGVSSSLGTIGNTSVSGVSKNAIVTITASNGAGCFTSASITTPNADCPTACTLPKLTVGNGVCNGTTWQASFTETTGATISTNAGTISGNKVINIPVGTNLSIIATNGTCISTITTTSPSSCSTTTDSCNVPLVSIGGSNCKSDGSAFYTVYYTKLNNRVSITSTAGTVNNDSITDIPSGTNATITATLSGCANQTKVTVSSKQCPSCVKPTLTAGNINCNGTNYMINFQSNATNGVSSSLGTVSGNTITGVSKSSNVVITASNGPGCTTSTTVSTPNLNCPTACVLPQLMVGNAVCNGTSWEFSFNETTGATIQTTSGTISGNKVTGITVGTNVAIIAVNGTCISTVTVTSPSSCGGDPCANPLVSIGGTNCKSNGSNFYSVYFTKAGSSVVVKSSAGTVSGDSVIDVPSGTNVVISATLSGCKDTTKVTVSGRQCPTCIRPTLTAGNISCVGSSYTIDFSSNATNGVSASTGVIGTNKITGVAKNASVTLIATNGSGCNTSTTVTTPNLDCPSACTLPQLTAGNGICNGSNWEFSFSELTGASISTNFGTISGNKVINIPINSDVTITATNGSCVSNITVVRPVSCIDPCANPLISIGGSNCKNDGSAFYTVYISKLNSSVSIATSAGTVSGDSIVNIPSGSSVSITGTLAGCGTSTNISLPARQCPSCLKPSLTAGNISCNGSSYAISFASNASGGVTTNLGSVGTNSITGIAKNSNVVITASNGSGCTTTATVSTPNTDCPTSCVLPQLTVGTGVCNGSNYEVSFIENTGATVSTSVGTISGNKVINIPVGTNVVVTATSSGAACTTSVTASSPARCGTDTCSNPLISFGGTKCKTDGSAFYTVFFSRLNSRVLVTASAGTVSGDSVVSVPSGTNITLSATLNGCGTSTSINVSAKQCPTCVKPTLTAGNISCDGTNYMINFSSNASVGVTASTGTISGNTISNISKNSNVVITASNGSGCSTSTSVSTPNVDCPSACVLPQLTAGNGICNGATWDLSFTESTGASVTISAGSISGNKVTGIAVGTNVTLTASNGTCISTITINSPTSCSDPCSNPLLSVSGTKCKTDGSASYTIYFTKASSSVSVTTSAGTVSGDSIVNVPSSSSPTITATLSGCGTSTSIVVPAKQCPTCIKPALSAGDISCNGTSYTMNFFTNATNGVTSSNGTVSGNSITNVDKNSSVTIIASNGAGCTSTTTVRTPNLDCPTACVLPKLTAGNSICTGSTWEFSFTENTNATITTTSGTISGNKVTNIGNNTDVTITATNGSCISSIVVVRPASCNDPCSNSLVSIGGSVCRKDGGAFYTVYYSKLNSNVTVTSNLGTVMTDSIINVPSGSSVTVTAKLTGCSNSTIVTVPAKQCPTCVKPTLTIGKMACSGTNYNIEFISNALNGVSVSSGTISGNTITGVLKNTTVTVTASNGTGCTTSMTATTPNIDCPTACVMPNLTLGNGLCNGSTWEVSFTESTGATITPSAGTRSGNKIINIPIGTNLTLTASNGSCTAALGANSPTNCSDPCSNPLVSISGTKCNPDGTATYTAYFTKLNNNVIVSTTAGTISGDSIINIPSTSSVKISASLAGCSSATEVTLPAQNCPSCVKPLLTAGNISCNGNYVINFLSNATGGVTSSVGTISGNTITGVPKNTTVTITASNGTGCTTKTTVSTPNADCPTTCVLPQLTAGNGVCNGSNWEISFSESTGATVFASSGTISGNKVIDIPVGTNVTISAINGTCNTNVNVTSPTSCSSTSCDKPLISLGGTKCNTNGTKMYTAYFIKTSSSVVVTATLGTVSGDSIINIPSDSTPTVTATLTGCSSATVVKLPSKACAVCIAPVLTVGSATCSGSSYEFTFTTNASQGITTTAGTVSGDKVIGVPKNIAVTITASNGTGCSTVLKVNTPNTDCPNNSTACVTPKLVAGNGVCNGSTWEFSFTEITGAQISVSSGTISGNKVIGIAVGTNVTIIASNNPTCVVSLNVSSPANCSSTDPCEKQLISIGGTKCNATGTAYSIFFTKSSASVVVTSKFGTVSGDSIINIPNGKIDTVFASLPGCSKSVVIPVKSTACLGFEANIDNSKVTSGGSKSINVSTNDNLTASSNYKFKVGTNPKKGTVVIDSVTGIATYKSTDTSYKGIDSFTYTVTDPITGEVKTAMVYVTVGNPDNIDVVVPEGNGKEVDGEDYSDNNLSIKTKNYTVNTNPSNGTISDFDPATGAFKYTPTPGKCGKDSTRIMVVYTYAESGKTADTFFYMVRFNVPCSSNDIPNYITPNGDGINDVFVIPNFATKYRNAKLMIYNRWGNIVWRSYGSYQNNWSGSHYDGQPLPDGVYYYMIENEVDKDLVQPVTGFIQIGRD